jgi:putative ABC transport system ATP-binding protein
MLVIRSLSKSVPGTAQARRTLFSALDLDVPAGEFVAVMGESGVGKSTLLNLIAGLDTPDTGSIAIEGKELAGLDDDRRTLLRRSHIGFVFQAFHILPYLSVAWNVALPLVLLGKTEREAEVDAHEMLERVGMADRAMSMPRELSGGELQRVAIARALVHRPKLVLADEPTGNLDPDTAHGVAELLRARIKEDGAAGILVTHSRAAAATTDRILSLTPQGLRPPAGALA